MDGYKIINDPVFGFIKIMEGHKSYYVCNMKSYH